MQEKPQKKLTRKRILMRGVQWEKERQKLLFEKLQIPAPVAREMHRNSKPLTQKPFEGLFSVV